MTNKLPRVFCLLTLALLVLPATAQVEQLRINEIDYDGKWVEFFYPADATGQIDASSLCLCSRPIYETVGSQTVLSGSTTMNPGDFLAVSWDPVLNFDASDGEVGLYASCSGFGDEASMIDYMEYGSAHSGGDGREDVAVDKGIWGAGTFVALAPAGKTLSYFGGGFGVSNWDASEPTQGSTNAVLPVELVTFEATADGAEVTLRWATISETGNAGFEVQHRSSSGLFQRVAFVDGAGTTTEAQHYTYTVDLGAPGRHAFRLKQVDFDGVFVYSPEVEVIATVPEGYQLTPPYPNPFNPETRFTLTVGQDQPVRVVVIDALGREVARLHDGLLPAHTAHTFRLEAADLPSGLYLIHTVGAYFTDTRVAVLSK